MKEVTCYKTIDGKVFDTAAEAREHESTLFPRCKACGGPARYVFYEQNPNRNIPFARIKCTKCYLAVSIESRKSVDEILKTLMACWSKLMEK